MGEKLEGGGGYPLTSVIKEYYCIETLVGILPITIPFHLLFLAFYPNSLRSFPDSVC